MHRCRAVIAVALWGSCAFALSAAAQSNGAIDYNTVRLDRKLPATRATGRIELDGRLDEPAWTTAPVAKDFIQNDPREGSPATYDTEVRLIYDDDALYIGVFARDPDPGAIIINELRKDFNTGNGDSFQVVIDTFKDERNGYQFAVNPAGAKWDAQMSNEGRENNSNWDGVWDVRTRISEEGWYAELRIPFRTLKFSPSAEQTWGINFQRRLRRLNENSYWAPLPRIHSLSRVSMAGSIEGLQGIQPGNNFRIKPYALASSSRVGQGANQGDFDAGFDVKYGVTSGLTWDFTVNTDFSQVEADEQQINLTRFSLFFPEKRDFFLENSGIFQFGVGSAGGGGGGGGRQNPSQDMILFFSRRIGLSDEGAAIPLPGGTRLTGRAAGFSIGALNIQQRQQGASPSTNFTALRLRRDVFAQSDIGVIVLNKETSGPHFNRVLGADANFRFFQNLDVNFASAKTFSPEDAGGATGEDWYSKSSFNYNSNRLAFRGGYQTIGDRFNNEMGFVPRRGVNNGELHAGARFRPNWNWTRGWLRETYPHWQIENFARRGGGGLESRYIDWHWPVTFHDSTFIEVGVNPTVEVIRTSFVINSRRNIRIPPGRYEFNENFVLWRTNAAAPVAVNGRYSTGEFYDGYRHAYELGGTVRANEHFNVSGNVSFNDIDLPQGAFTTTLVSGRVNYFLNTKMALNALLQYNTDARQWSSNIRFNVIHRPLSDIFLVYNERRDSRTGDMIDRALVAKMTYLIAF